MKRGGRWALNILAGLLLAAAAAMTVLWLTPATGDRALVGTRSLELEVSDARLCVSWRPKAPYRPAWAGQVTRHGVRYNRWSDGSGEIAVPLWWPVAACAAAGLAAAWLGRRLHRGAAEGLCPRCSYDLRATPRRCPECGFIPSEHAAGPPI